MGWEDYDFTGLGLGCVLGLVTAVVVFVVTGLAMRAL